VIRVLQADDNVRLTPAMEKQHGSAAAVDRHPAPLRPLTAAEYAGTVSGFVNLTMSFDSGIDVMGSTYF